jgi:antitoxin component YwqK of YwqJK toxin-antitoxin module
VVKQLDYDKGSVRQLDKETFSNKQSKFEINVLSGKAKLVSKGDYESLTLATCEPDGAPFRDGVFVYYHENGTVRTRGTFKRGEVHTEKREVPVIDAKLNS